MLLRVLGGREDALDVVQEAFVQAFVKVDTFREEAKFSTWLYRIAMNRALSHRRRRRVGMSIEDAKQQWGKEPMSHQPGPESRLIENERAALLQSALATLGEQHRQLLVLREMERCSYEQIAGILELPMGTVRSRLFRARMQLKERLRELMPDA